MVSNLAQLVTSLDMDEAERNKLIDRIRANADRSLELVNTILEVAALGTGKITIEPKPFLFTQGLQDAIDNYSALAHERNINIEVNIPRGLIIVGDQPRLQQVFNNLIGNAIKYCGAGRRVAVSFEGQHDDRGLFSISNSYAGDQDDDVSLNVDIHKSVGFGMDIAREILALHGSDLEISKENDSFSARISLPLAADPTP